MPTPDQTAAAIEQLRELVRRGGRFSAASDLITPRAVLDLVEESLERAVEANAARLAAEAKVADMAEILGVLSTKTLAAGVTASEAALDARKAAAKVQFTHAVKFPARVSK